MAKETNKKSEGPACACGKGNLYDEWLKLQENQKEAGSDSTISNQAKDNESSADDAAKEA
jgi:uncharacterized protein (DUF983 family)